LEKLNERTSDFFGFHGRESVQWLKLVGAHPLNWNEYRSQI